MTSENSAGDSGGEVVERQLCLCGRGMIKDDIAKCTANQIKSNKN